MTRNKMTKNKEIRQVINQITERIKKEYQPEKIILFGSHAYGKPTEDSDIDLLIIKETDKRRTDRFCEVRKILRDIRGVSIQPVVLTKAELNSRLKLRDDFILEIMEKGEVLYEG
jgi:predicted nucleotidyltransferase